MKNGTWVNPLPLHAQEPHTIMGYDPMMKTWNNFVLHTAPAPSRHCSPWWDAILWLRFDSSFLHTVLPHHGTVPQSGFGLSTRPALPRHRWGFGHRGLAVFPSMGKSHLHRWIQKVFSWTKANLKWKPIGNRWVGWHHNKFRPSEINTDRQRGTRCQDGVKTVRRPPLSICQRILQQSHLAPACWVKPMGIPPGG